MALFSLNVPMGEAQLPVTTGAQLNDMINRGYRFTAESVVGGERVRVLAFCDFIDAETCSIVTGTVNDSKFRDVHVASIRRIS